MSAVVATTALGATVARFGAEAAPDSLSRVETQNPAWSVTLIGVPAAICVVSAWLNLKRPSLCVGLSLLVLGWLAPSWADVGAVSPRWRVGLLAAEPLVVAGLSLIVGAAGRAGRPSASWVAVAGSVSTAAVAVAGLGYDPFADPECRTICSAVEPVLRAVLSTSASIGIGSSLTLVAIAIVVAEIVWLRPPIGQAAAAYLALVGLATHAVGSLVGWTASSVVSSVVAVVGTTVLGGLIASGELRIRSVRRAVESLVKGLSGHESQNGNGHGDGHGHGQGNAHATAAESSVDRRTALYAIPGERRWVDGNGLPVVPYDEYSRASNGRAWRGERWLELRDQNGPAVRLALTSTADENAVLGGLTAATRLALHNARLAAIGRARLLEVQQSRRRAVAAGDDERRRLERDLHDGAQQRLVSIALQLSVARARADSTTAPTIDRAAAAVRNALAGVREVAQGVFPSGLAEDGLAEALQDYLADTHSAASMEVDVRSDLDPQATIALYSAATRALEVGASSFAATRLRVEETDGRIRLIADLTGTLGQPLASFEDVGDRVGALGGTFTIRHGPSGDVTVTAVIP